MIEMRICDNEKKKSFSRTTRQNFIPNVLKNHIGIVEH